MNSLDFKFFLERDEDYGGYVLRCSSMQGLLLAGKNSRRGHGQYLGDY
jgi:hypothetical protein